MKPVKFLRGATAEVLDARAHYAEEEGALLAMRFDRELDQAIRRILTSPHAFVVRKGGTRRVHLARFPYSVVYRDLPDFIEVVAVPHDRREPDYWMKRLRKPK